MLATSRPNESNVFAFRSPVAETRLTPPRYLAGWLRHHDGLDGHAALVRASKDKAPPPATACPYCYAPETLHSPPTPHPPLLDELVALHHHEKSKQALLIRLPALH